MPAANFTRFFADIQRLFEAGDRAGAEALFQSELPYVLWAMQSIDCLGPRDQNRTAPRA